MLTVASFCRAFDTGPGNVMIDHTMRARMGLEYDKDGETAKKGTAIEPLLEELMSREFFARKVRVSIPSTP